MIRPKRLTLRGFSGASDSLSPDDPRCFLMENCFLREPNNPKSDILVRQGWFQESATAVTGTSPALFEFVTNSGLVLAGAVTTTGIWLITSLNSAGAATVTNTVTTAQLTAAGISLGAGPFNMITFNGQMVVADGTNTPWMWDGTAGGGLTKLTNAPVAYGLPAVYYARLFFIKSTDRVSAVWSEVNAANTGYEAGGYNNVWALLQTGTRPLEALLGTNEALYYFRSTAGIGAIRGAVTSTFSTTGTHDGISRTVGLVANSIGGGGGVAPKGLAMIGGDIYFGDTANQVWVLRGGTLTQLCGANSNFARRYGSDTITANKPYNLQESMASATSDALVQCYGFVRNSALGHVYAVFQTGTANQVFVYVLDEVSGRVLGTERWLQVGQSGAVTLPTLKMVLALGANSTFVSRAPMAIAANVVWGSDQGGGGGFVATVIGPAMGYGEAVEWTFDEMSVVFEGNATDASAVIKVSYLTDQEHYSTLIPAQQTATAYDASYQVKEQRAIFGINAHGAWIRPYIQLSSTGRMALKSVSVLGFPVEDTVAVA